MWADDVIATAEGYLGLFVGTPEGHSQVMKWLSAVHVPEMANWCAAFAHGVCAEALGDASAVPEIAGALRMYAAMAEHHVDQPRPGALYFVDHGGGLGHVGIVTGVDTDMVTEISGNTLGVAARTGGHVESHWWSLHLARKGAAVHGGKLVGFALPVMVPGKER
jgi:hypothetical protein